LLSILCALAVLASGKKLTLESLQEMCRLIDENPPAEELKGIMLLQQALIGDSYGCLNGKEAQGSIKAQIESLCSRVNRVEENMNRLLALRSTEVPGENKIVSLRETVKGKKDTSSEKSGPAAHSGEEQGTVQNSSACYLYGVVEYREGLELECSGIDEKQVYLLIAEGLTAVVHRCSPEPYVTENEELAKTWVERHNDVLEKCAERFPAVLPYAFNTILHDPSKEDADLVVVDWLKKEAPQLEKRLAKVKNRQEYGVQLLWNTRSIADELLQVEQELAALKQNMAGQSAGAAYIYKEKLERLLKDKMEALAANRHRELIEKIRPFCADFKVERNKKTEDGYEMIGNWSCLVAPDQVEALGAVLEEVAEMKGHKVRFTGPWPPYSFVD